MGPNVPLIGAHGRSWKKIGQETPKHVALLLAQHILVLRAQTSADTESYWQGVPWQASRFRARLLALKVD